MRSDSAVPSSGPRWPQLDQAALYGLTGEVVRALLPHTEADPAALVLDFLCGFGVMTGNEAGAQPHAMADGAKHPARINGLVVGETSRARKSSAFTQMMRLFRRMDSDFCATRVLSGFGSGEALIDDVAESEDKRMWVVESEFSRVLTAAAREGSILSHVMRQAWDGDRLSVRTRKKRAVADEAHVAVLGHITLDELRANAKSMDVASGFLNRFLIVLARRSQLLPSGGSLDDGDLRRLSRKVNHRLSQSKHIGLMTRSEMAERLWKRLYGEMAGDDPGDRLGALIARSEAQVLRLSVAYALTDGSPTIKTQHLKAAWALWEYCRASVAYVFGRGIVADTICQALIQVGESGLSRTELHKLLGGHRQVEQLDRALAGLEREGVIEITQEKGRAGRPKTRVRLNRHSATT
jgi:DNA-binding transcriptional ArsR family regulator